MSRRAVPVVGWALLALSAVLAVGGLVFYALSPSVGLTGGGSRGAELSFAGSFLACATVGALIVSRRPGNRIGWLLLVAGLAWEVRHFSVGYAAYALVKEPGSLPGGQWMAWLQTWFWGPAFAITTIFLLLGFPNGRLLSRRWLAVAWLGGVSAGATMIGQALAPGPIPEFAFVANPVGIGGAGWLEYFSLTFALSVFLSAISMVLRFRRAGGDERQQLKWFALASALFALPVTGAFFIPETEPGLTITQSVVGLALAGLPIAVGIAIFKHGLYDIDVIIRRTLVYGALSALLAGLYFGIVLALQQVFSSFAGGSDLAIAVSTLAVAALFRPVRGRIQAFVDRRFYRRRYDAQRTLEAFSARVRDEVSLEALGGELRAVVQETMQPAHVSLWLREPGGSR